MKKTNKKTKTYFNANCRESPPALKLRRAGNANGRELDYSREFTLDLRKFALNKNSHLSFQDRVLRAVCQIPFGQVRSYAWVAKKIGCPKAGRAVGQALKKNPYPLIIPCHRVVQFDGSLGGYAGGRKIKKLLINLEKYLVDKLRTKTS